MYKHGPYLEASAQVILIDSFGLLAADDDVPEHCWHSLPTLLKLFLFPVDKHSVLNCVRSATVLGKMTRALTYSPLMTVVDLPLPGHGDLDIKLVLGG
jgi:hypothetical protein